MRAVLGFSLLSLLGCKEEEGTFELNARRIGELANATCACSDSVSVLTCVESLSGRLNASLLPQVQASRVRVDGALWADCIAERRECDRTSRSCEDLFEGTLEKGASCDFLAEECAPGLHCVPEDPQADPRDGVCALAGTCEELDTFEHGEPCEPTGRCEDRDDICGVATSGDEEGELICRAPLEEGDACPVEDFGPLGIGLCEPGTACAPDGDEIVCSQPLEEGKACAFMVGEVIAAGSCKSGTYCDMASGMCTRFPFPEGAEKGDECEATTDCQPGLACIDDECGSPLPNGSECDEDEQCAASCHEGVCTASHIACDLQ
jgi:hypothetical protein